jgi:ketosteroid isomerase-like protein
MHEDELEAIVASLESQLEIEELSYHFVHAVDRRDVDQFLSLWTADATLQSDSQTYRGRDSIRHYLDEIQTEFPVSHHYVANNDIRVSGNVAEGMCDHDVLAATAKGETVILAASAFDRYRRVDQVWRIEQRKIETCHSLVLPGVALTANPRPW